MTKPEKSMKAIIEVPLSEISTADESGETVAPERGDLVTVTTRGKVVEVVGDKARVEVGPDEGEAATEPGEEDMERELRTLYENENR